MRILVFAAIVVLQNVILAERDCAMNALKSSRNFKIYLNGFHWTMPVDNYNGSKVTIEHGEMIRFNCDHGFVKEDLPAKSYLFECTDGKFNKTLSYADLLCKSDFHKNTKVIKIPNIQFRSAIFRCDEKGLEVYQVNAQKEDGSLRHLYTVCFDKNVMRTKFVVQPKRGEISTKRHGGHRKNIWGFDYFGKNALEKLKLSEGYVSRIQRLRITKFFPDKYNQKHKYPYTFNRGHLAPYGDFIDQNDKMASCEYINVAPQWKEFNGNSWSLIESETRGLAGNDPGQWEIYTGTYASIPTARGPLLISPFFDENGKFVKAFVPVPKLFWKIAFNTLHKNNSRVFLGVNNPELKSPEEFTDKYLLCKPKINERGTYFRGSEFKGFTYECGLDEFLERLGKDEHITKLMNSANEN